MKTCFKILKHEIRKILSDKKLLASMILMPILVILITSVVAPEFETSESISPKIYSLNNVVIEEGLGITPVQYATLEELKNHVELSSADVVLDSLNDKTIIYCNESNIDSYNTAITLETLLRQKCVYEIIGVTEPFNVSFNDIDEEMKKNNALAATILPYMLVLLLFQNTSSYAINTIAGERERGVFAKTLLAPISPAPVILGKILSSTICGIISCIFYFIITLSFESITGKDTLGIKNANLTVGMIFAIFLCAIIFCCFISSLGVFCSLKAKDLKDAQSSNRVIFVLVTIASLMSMLRMGELEPKLYLIPIYNICILMQDILYSIVNINNVIITIETLAACSIAIWGLTIISFKKESLHY